MVGDGGHHAHGLHRVRPHGGLFRKHDGVGPVEDRVGDVARLGARSGWIGLLGDDPNAYRNPCGAGDVHVYQRYPTTWSFIEAFGDLGRNTKPVFVSEGGLGSSFNAIRAERKMREAGAPAAFQLLPPSVLR